MFDAFRLRSPLPAALASSQSATVPEQPSPSKRRRSSCSAQHQAGAGSPQPAVPPAPRELPLEKLGDAPLRCIIVGHNPSNPTNRLWPILRETGIAPPDEIAGAQDDDKMPEVAGVGFTDVGSGYPGTDSSQFTSQDFEQWRPGFYSRLAKQAERASAAIPGCTCSSCGAPVMVAFSGKRQFQELFARPATKSRSAQAVSPPAPAPAAAIESAGCQMRLPILQERRPGRIDTGRQWVLPAGWPLPLHTEVWVLTSTSGAAPMTREQRIAPWQALAQRLAAEAWPRQCVARCSELQLAPGGAG
ncbi:hypothetical protein ACK3TF_001313 [Chlorella vulgaris]